MKRIVFFGALALILLVQSPFILALDVISCGKVDSVNLDTCLGIRNSGLSDEEKNILISNLDYSGKFFPDHEFIFQKNTNIEISNAPNSVQTHSGMFVRNAWVEIFTAMPSVLFKDDLYVPDNIALLSGFNYNVEIPRDYYSSGYPSTSGGDCKRTYNVIRNSAVNKVFLNDDFSGEGKLVNLDIDSDSVLKSEYIIQVSVNVDHYDWRRFCRDREDGKCVRYGHRCKYNYGEIINDRVEIIDSIEFKHYKDDLQAGIELINEYLSTSKLRTSFSKSVEINFENAQFSFNEFVFDIVYSKSPYFVYTLKAKEVNQEKLVNVLKDNNDLLVKNTNDCQIKAFDFFNIIEKDCDISGEIVNLKLSTDKLRYKVGETIVVKITPSDFPVTVTYGGESKEAVGTVNFVAQFFYNKIIASYKDRSSEKVIFIDEGVRFRSLFDLSIFGLLNYCIYAFLSRGLRRFL